MFVCMYVCLLVYICVCVRANAKKGLEKKPVFVFVNDLMATTPYLQRHADPKK